MGYWNNVLKKWANENFQTNLAEYESDVLDQTLSQFYAELRKDIGDDYEPDCLKVMQVSLERYLKSKAYAKSIIRYREFLSSRKVLEGKTRKLREQAQESDQTDPEVWQTKRKKSSGRTASLEEALHELYLTPSGGCSLSTLAYEGDKNTTKWKLNISLNSTATTDTNF